MKTNRKAIGIDLMQKNCLLSLIFPHWGNKRVVDPTGLKTSAKTSRMHLTLDLVDSPEYRAVRRFTDDVKRRILRRCMPSYIQEALWMCDLTECEYIDKIVEDGKVELSKKVAAFVKAYPSQVKAAQQDLIGFWDAKQYPAADTLAGLFDIRHQFVEFGVPKNLPQQLRIQQADKLQKSFDEALVKMRESLRMMFGEILDHATDRLKVNKDEKAPVFKDSLVQNFKDFVETFSIRNFAKDEELAKLVGQCERIIGDKPVDITAEAWRENEATRKQTLEALTKVKSEMDKMVGVRASRVFRTKKPAAE